MIEIYTDGSCCGNGKETNVGGFGVVSMCGNLIKDKYGCRYENTTNNRMEMEALLYALDLSQTKYQNDKVIIYSDSAYCVNIFNNWIHSWARNGWTRAGNKTIENLDLVKKFYKYVTIPLPNFEVVKISGHSGFIGNEIADALATNNEAKLAKILQENEDLHEKYSSVDF